MEAVSDHQQVVDHPFRARPVRTNVKVADRAELGSHCGRDVDGLAYEGLDIRCRVANVRRYAPAEHPVFFGRHLFPYRSDVSSLHCLDVALPRVPTVPRGWLPIGKVVYELLEHFLDVLGFRRAPATASCRVSKEASS